MSNTIFGGTTATPTPLTDLSEYVKNTDYATTGGKAGIVQLNQGKGIFRANMSPTLEIVAASKDEIDKKEQRYKPIVPNTLNYAVKSVAYDKAEVDAKIGDIESALDELHAYAQALISGGAAE